MRLVVLKPIIDNPKHWETLERKLISLFKQHIYIPLLREIKANPKILLNTKEDLIAAILAGHIRYHRGGFTGNFTSAISKELQTLGAYWSSRWGSKWVIKDVDLSADIQVAIRQADRNANNLLNKLTDKINTISPDTIIEHFDPIDLFEKVIASTDNDFRASVAQLTLVPKLSDQARDTFAKEYTYNLDKYIRTWVEDEIVALRKRVEAHAFKGERAAELAKQIQASYGVSQRKARFLARQETNLLTSKLKQVRYADAGIDEYYWHAVIGTSEHPTRHRHKQLNDESEKGKTFRFSDPPITTEPGEPERRNNPGEDYNCRCTARPVVRFK